MRTVVFLADGVFHADGGDMPTVFFMRTEETCRCFFGHADRKSLKTPRGASLLANGLWTYLERR